MGQTNERERQRASMIAAAYNLFKSLESVGLNPDVMLEYFVADLDKHPEPLDPEIWMVDGFVRA